MNNTKAATYEILNFIHLSFSFQSIYYTIFGWPLKDLNNELCVVTGGGGGLGRLLAMRLARLGVKVILWDINQDGKFSTRSSNIVKVVSAQNSQLTLSKLFSR